MDPLIPDFSPEDRFLAWALGGSTVFLTGQAGTGKSTLLRRYLEQAGLINPRIAVTASTGIAALNICGSTIHRWAGIELGAAENESFEEATERLEARTFLAAYRARQRVQEIATVILDEVSMIPGRQLDFIDHWFRAQRKDERPFGGVQMIFVGDFLQLPPVRKSDHAPYDWAFKSKVWEQCLDKTILLETVHRQEEKDFTAALQGARVGNLNGQAARVLMPRVLENPERDCPRLYTHNAQVDKWCSYMLEELPGEEIVLEAVTEGNPQAVDSLKKNILAPEHLRLKRGALVMNLVNKKTEFADGSKDLLVNGQLGHVERVDGSGVEVRFGDRVANVQRHVWSWSHHPPAKGGPSFIQFPLRLAYAMTIHKCQGLTLDRAHVDIRAAREPGQAYVALSRVRTLQGLSLKEWPRGIFVSPAAIEFYRKMKPPWPGPAKAEAPAAPAAAAPAKPTPEPEPALQAELDY